MRAYHTLIAGDSGSGKTTLMRQIHDEFQGLTIWVDHDNAGGISGRDLEGAATVHSEAEARRATATKLRLVVDDPEEGLRIARAVGLDYRERTGWPWQVVLDEAQNVLDEDLERDHPAKKMLHEDRDQAGKFVVGTQDPTDLRPNYSALKQCRWFTFVGIPSPFHRGFADYFSLPKGEMPEREFQYVVFGKTEAFKWGVEFRGETEKRYA